MSTLYDALVSGGVLVINPFVRAACQDAEQKGLPVEAREVVEEAPDNAVSRGSWSQYRECGGGNLRRIVPGGQVAARMPAPRLTSQARRGR
ncbi:hypothetical protein AB0D59_48315 [Streptomyces sp. NPDC048417]|uniref:hypothetical protein n=1 Tax=Streptomyces sp. NPDC048417 TaxID=3155387 RepID=UPI0034494115